MKFLIVFDAGVRHIIVDTDREMALRLRLGEFIVYGHYHRRSKLFRRQAIPSANNVRHRAYLAVADSLGKCCYDILIERLSACANLFGSIKHRNRLYGIWNGLQEVLRRERPIQADINHAKAFGG